jgi:hypothetical protein
MTVILIPIATNRNEYAKPKHSQRRPYVKKRNRWIRVRNLARILGSYIAFIGTQIGKYETTWREYKIRCTRSKKIRWAQVHTIKSESYRHHVQNIQKETWRKKRLTMQETIAMSSVNAHGEPIHQNVARFDTDSGRVSIDNRANACISAFIQDFQGPVKHHPPTTSKVPSPSMRSLFIRKSNETSVERKASEAMIKLT